MASARLFVEIGAKTSAFQKALSKIERDVNKFSRKMESMGRSLTQSITLPLAGLGAASVATFAQFDKLEKGLSAIAGSSAEGKRQMESLLDVVKDVRTTIGLEDAARGSLQLQAVGIAAERAENTLRQLAIAATLSGGSGEDVAEVARQLSQAAAKGNILQQELRIILERIPALAGVIKNEFGTVTAEGLRAAGVSADQFIDRLTKAIERNDKFQNVQASLSKQIETFRINLQLAGKTIGESIAKALNLEKNLERLSGFIERAANAFAGLSDRAKRIIVISALVAAAIGPLLLIIGKMVQLIPALTAAISFLVSPVGLVVAGIAALAAGFIYAYNSSEKFRRVINGLVGVIVEMGKIAGEVLIGLVKSFMAIQNFRFREAGESLKGVLKSINMFEIGKRMGAAWVDGYSGEAEKIETPKAITNFLSGHSGANIAAGPSLNLGGETQKFKFFESYSQALQRVIANTERGKAAIQREFSSIGEAAAQLAAKTRPALQSLEIMPNGLIQAREELQLLGDKMTAIGAEPADILNAKIDALKQKIQEAVEKFGLLSPQVQRLREELQRLEEQREGLESLSDAMQEMANIVGGVLNQAFEEFFTTVLEGGKDAFKSFTRALLDGLKKILAQMLATLATAAALAAIFSVLTGGSFSALFGGFLSGGRGGSIFGALFKLPGFAEGGIVPPGYPNDSYLARLSSNEAVIPLNKLDRYLGGGNLTGEFIIRGQDLVLAVERNQNERRRSRGI